MRLHTLEHVEFEDLANIQAWAAHRGHAVTRTRLYTADALPGVEELDWLIVMGGPMNVADQWRYPWLPVEKRFIARAIEAGKAVLGVCLGAQLLAEVLGGRVRPNAQAEIGWLDVDLTEAGRASELLAGFPQRFEAFHWHGDTFDLPDGAVHLARSAGCANQAFAYEDRVVALQFHLESNDASIRRLIENAEGELPAGPFVQSPEQMLDKADKIERAGALLGTLLDAMERAARRR